MTRVGLELAAANTALDLARPEQMPETAIAALEHGLDSPALRALAALSHEQLYEAPQLLRLALTELEVPVPDASAAVLRLARAVATEVVDGSIAPYDGAKRIWELTLRAPEQAIPELDSFVYAASEWDGRPEDQDRLEDGIRQAAYELSERN